MRCLVLGGGGFIGGHLCELLLAQGHAVRAFERSGFDAAAHPYLDGVEWRFGDFTREADVQPAIAGSDVLFHLAATTLPATSNRDPVYDLESNVSSTLRLLEAARRHGLRKVVFISSGGTVYGACATLPIPESAPTEPICAYGVHKLAIEKYLHLWHRLHGLDYAVLRVANPYGERQRHDRGQGSIAVFLAHALRGEPIQLWGDGSVVRDYLHVADVARALALAAQADTRAKVFNIGSGVGRSLNEVLGLVEAALGTRLVVQRSAARAFDVPASVLDVALAARELQWRPAIGMEEGLARTARWMRAWLRDGASDAAPALTRRAGA